MPQYSFGDAKTGVWTPDLSGGTVDLGTGAIQQGQYIKIGPLVIIWAYMEWGTSPNLGSGNYRIVNLPFAFSVLMPSDTLSGQGKPMGTLSVWDSSAAVHRDGHVARWQTEPDGFIGMIDSAATANMFMNSTVPWTWAVGDEISLQAQYLTDS